MVEQTEEYQYLTLLLRCGTMAILDVESFAWFGGAIMTQKRERGRRVQPQEARVTFGPSANPALTAAILEVVDTQLRENTPPETRQTFERLVTSGYAPEDARRLIGNVVVQEIFHVLQRRETYNEERYLAALHGLPDSAV